MACGPRFDGLRRPETVSARLAAALADGPGATFDLREVTPFGWRRVCILGPRTSVTILADSLQLPTDTGLARGIDRRDDIDLLVFSFQHVPPASMAHPRRSGAFGPTVHGRCFSNADAKFVVQSAPDGGPLVFGQIQ
jgi:hypothetical protein